MVSIIESLDEKEAALIRAWYQLDTNAVPSAFALQPWPQDIQDFASRDATERRLLTVLRKAALVAGVTDRALTKYMASATHQEIVLGALDPTWDVANQFSSVLVMARQLDSRSADSSLGIFSEANDGVKDHYAEFQMQELKDKLSKRLGDNYITYHASSDAGRLVLDNECFFIEKLRDWLTSVIIRELETTVDEDAITVESLYHWDHARSQVSGFTGRQEMLRLIDAYLSDSKRSNVFFLAGESGSGKTCIMARAALDAISPYRVVIARFIGANASSSSSAALISSLCEEIARSYGRSVQDLAGQNRLAPMSETDKAARLFVTCAELATATKPLIIFIDALDQLVSQDSDPLAWMPTRMPEHAKLVVSSRSSIEHSPSEAQTAVVGAMSRSSVEEMLNSLLDSHGRTLTSAQRAEVVRGGLASGLPLYLRMAAELACGWTSSDPVPQLPDSIEGLIENFLDELERDHSRTLVETTIGYILAGRYSGLTEDEIVDLLAFDKECWQHFLKTSHPAHRREVEEAKRMPAAVWSRLLLGLKPYFTEKESLGEHLIAFHHAYLKDVAAKRYCFDDAHRNSVLADYYRGQPVWRDEAGGVANERRASELGWQFLRSEQFRELHDHLIDFSELRAAFTVRGHRDIAADYMTYARAGRWSDNERQVLADFYEFIRDCGHRVVRRPELIRQEALNYSRESATHAKAEAYTARTHPLGLDIIGRGTKVSANHVDLGKHERKIIAAGVAPSGARAFSRSDGGLTKIWNIRTYKCETTITTASSGVKLGDEGGVVEEDALLAAEARLGTPIFWPTGSSKRSQDVTPGKLQEMDDRQDENETPRSIWCHPARIDSFAIMPQDPYLITTCHLDGIRLWSLDNGTLAAFWRSNTLFRCALPIGNQAVAFGTSLGGIEVWNPIAGLRIASLTVGKGAVLGLGMIDYDKGVVAALSQKRVSAIRLQDGKCLWRATIKAGGCERMAVAWKAGKILVSNDSRNILVIDSTTGIIEKEIPCKFVIDRTDSMLDRSEKPFGGLVVAFPDGIHVLTAQEVQRYGGSRRAQGDKEYWYRVDGVLRVWDLRSVVCVREYVEVGRPDIVSISPDGQLIFMHAMDRNDVEYVKPKDYGSYYRAESVVKVIDVASGKTVWQKPSNILWGSHHSSFFERQKSIAQRLGIPVFGSGGDLIIYQRSGAVALDARNGKILREFGCPSPVESVQTTTDGLRAVVAYRRQVDIWDVGHQHLLNSIYCDPQGLDWTQGARVYSRQGLDFCCTPQVLGVVLTANQTQACIVNLDGTTRLLDLATGRVASSDHLGTEGLCACAHSISGETLVTGTKSGRIDLWKLPDLECLSSVLTKMFSPTCLAMAGDGSFAVVGTEDGSVAVVRLTACSQPSEPLQLPGSVTGMCMVEADGVPLLATSSSDCGVRVWRMSDCTLVKHVKSAGGIKALHGRESHLAVVVDQSNFHGPRDAVESINLATEAITVQTVENRTECLFVLSADRVVTGGYDLFSGEFDLESNPFIRLYRLVQQDLSKWSIPEVEWYPGYGQSKIVALDEGVLPDTLLGLCESVLGKKLQLHQWRLAELDLVETVQLERDYLPLMRTNPAKQCTLVGHETDLVHALDVSTGECIWKPKPKGKVGKLTSLAVSGHGNIVVTGSEDHTMSLWSFETGEELGCVVADDAVTAVAISECETMVAFGDRSGSIHVFRIINS
jgi:WD40 repeat protein